VFLPSSVERARSARISPRVNPSSRGTADEGEAPRFGRPEDAPPAGSTRRRGQDGELVRPVFEPPLQGTGPPWTSPATKLRHRGSWVRFASDSPLEGDGFELSVPRKTPGVLAGTGSRSRPLSLVGGKQQKHREREEVN
jgi:hypothetical protein